jgi:hypothetical protein
MLLSIAVTSEELATNGVHVHQVAAAEPLGTIALIRGREPIGAWTLVPCSVAKVRQAERHLRVAVWAAVAATSSTR